MIFKWPMNVRVILLDETGNAPTYLGHIQVCFDSVQQLWAPKKLPKFFAKPK